MTAPSFSFTLQADPPAPSPSATAATPAVALAQRPPVKRGLVRAPRRDGAGGFARTSGDALDQEKLSNLLLFNGFPWAPDRTTHLDELRHMNANTARVFAQAYLADAITRFLPEQRLEEVRVTPAGTSVVIYVRTSKVREPSRTVEASRTLR
jgi:hypothetical protein